MFVKKIYSEKQKNRIFMLLTPCDDMSKEKDMKKLQRIASIFSTNFSVKLKSKNKKIANVIQASFPSVEILINEEKKYINLLFKLSEDNIMKLLKCVDFNETAIELFASYENYEPEQYLYGTENNCDFYMYILDNDGPFILFNQEVYDYDETAAKIKEVLLSFPN